jgi:hypothetical protein
LVQLDAHTAGVIVGIDKDTARVLTNQSTLQKNDIRYCKVSGTRAVYSYEAVTKGWKRTRSVSVAIRLSLECLLPSPFVRRGMLLWVI